MIKRIAIAAIAIIALTATSAHASTRPESLATDSATFETASIEALRVSALFKGLAEHTAHILNSPQPTTEDLELLIDTINRIATYSNCKSPLNKPDLDLLVDGFYSFAQAGGDPITEDEIRDDLSRFTTVGAVVEYLSSALIDGLDGNTQ